MSVDLLWSLPRVSTPGAAAGQRPRASYPSRRTTSRRTSARRGCGACRRWTGMEATATPPAPPRARSPPPTSRPARRRSASDGLRIAFVRKPGRRRGRAAGGKAKPDAAGKAPPSISGLADGPARFGEVDQLWVMPLDGGEAVRCRGLPLGVGTPVWFRMAAGSPSSPRCAATRRRWRARPSATRRVRTMRSTSSSRTRVCRYWDHWLTDGIVHPRLRPRRGPRRAGGRHPCRCAAGWPDGTRQRVTSVSPDGQYDRVRRLPLDHAVRPCCPLGRVRRRVPDDAQQQQQPPRRCRRRAAAPRRRRSRTSAATSSRRTSTRPTALILLARRPLARVRHAGRVRLLRRPHAPRLPLRPAPPARHRNRREEGRRTPRPASGRSTPPRRRRSGSPARSGRATPSGRSKSPPPSPHRRPTRKA